MIHAKFGPFRTNSFEVIAMLVNFSRWSVAILDFAKFHFDPIIVCGCRDEAWVKTWWQSGERFRSYWIFSVFPKLRPAAILDFTIQNVDNIVLFRVRSRWFVLNLVNFGRFRINRFEVIAIFVNFNQGSAAILDLAKFYFWPQNHLWGAEMKLDLKLDDNQANGFGAIEFLVFFQNSSWRPSWISKFKIMMIFSYFRSAVDDSCQFWSISD